jgi:hypothetical protein
MLYESRLKVEERVRTLWQPKALNNCSEEDGRERSQKWLPPQELRCGLKDNDN